MIALTAAIRSARVYIWAFVLTNVLAFGADLGIKLSVSLLAGAVLCALASYGFLINDLCDIRIDRINCRGRLENQPARALVGAVLLAFFFSIIAAILAIASRQPTIIVLALSVWFGLTFYSLVLRSIPFVSTAVASILCASPIWFPMAISGAPLQKMHLFLLQTSLLATFGRELILDIKDIHGDRACGRITVPVLFGERFTAIVAFILVVMATVLVVLGTVALPSNPFSVMATVAAVASMIGFWFLPASRIALSPRQEHVTSFILLSRIGCAVVPICMLLSSLGAQ